MDKTSFYQFLEKTNKCSNVYVRSFEFKLLNNNNTVTQSLEGESKLTEKNYQEEDIVDNVIQEQFIDMDDEDLDDDYFNNEKLIEETKKIITINKNVTQAEYAKISQYNVTICDFYEQIFQGDENVMKIIRYLYDEKLLTLFHNSFLNNLSVEFTKHKEHEANIKKHIKKIHMENVYHDNSNFLLKIRNKFNGNELKHKYLQFGFD